MRLPISAALLTGWLMRAASATTPIDTVVMVRELRFDAMSTSMDFRSDAYVLFRGGVVFRGIPAGAPSSWDADSLVLRILR